MDTVDYLKDVKFLIDLELVYAYDKRSEKDSESFPNDQRKIWDAAKVGRDVYKRRRQLRVKPEWALNDALNAMSACVRGYLR